MNNIDMDVYMNTQQPLFRGFSPETGKWEYGFGWLYIDYTEEYLKQRGITEKRARLYTEQSALECYLKSMGQYTGLQDENGVDIFEGDILSLPFRQDLFVGVMENGCFPVRSTNSVQRVNWKPYPLHGVVSWGYVVVGNVFENNEFFEE